MSSTSETGHAKNLAHFQHLIAVCKSYGPTYNPNRSSLQIASLQAQLTQAQAALAAVTITKTTFDNATNNRKEGFANLQAFSTQVVSALTAAGASDLAVADAKVSVRKLQGRRAATIKPAAAPATGPTEAVQDKHISVSQVSFDSQVDHFSKLVQTVLQQPNYNPNEKLLTVTALQAQLAQLSNLNSNVINTYTDWYKARINRSNVLYNTVTGLTQTASDVKQYVKSIFGVSSNEYKQLSGLAFKVV